MIVRVAEKSDNKKILELAERCPQHGIITFYPNRKPEFNTLHRLLDPDAWHLVACTGDKIIGLVGVIHFKARVLDKICKIGYVLDLKVDEEYRNGLTAFRLIKSAFDRLLQSDVDMVIVNVLKDNKSPLAFVSGRGGLPKAFYLGDNLIFNIIPLHFMRLNDKFEISEPDESDIPEIIELYSKHSKNFNIFPEITEEKFRTYLKKLEGLGLENFLIAKENGKIKAVTAIWDKFPYKTYQVLKLNFSIRFASFFLKFLSLFFRVPHPIEVHKAFRQLSLVLNVHDNCPEALDTLFRHVNNINMGSDYSVITFYANEKDPVFNFLKKYKGIKVKSEMYLFARNESILTKLEANSNLVLLDISMII